MSYLTFDFEKEGRRLPDVTPCNSPIEDIFYWEIQKRVALDATIARQAECPTRIGTFYLDFLLEAGGRRVGFECDGKNFHDRVRDAVRDRAIIDAGHAQRIYRLRGHDIYFHLQDALDLVRVRDPWLFSQRGDDNIKALATRQGNYHDEFGLPESGFPFAAVRWYQQDGDLDASYDDDDENDKRVRPTVVCWTDQSGG